MRVEYKAKVLKKIIVVEWPDIAKIAKSSPEWPLFGIIVGEPEFDAERKTVRIEVEQDEDAARQQEASETKKGD